MKTIYYYQTFCSLNKCIENSKQIDVIIVSSLHLGSFKNVPYIHLNNYDPNSPKFDIVWQDLQKLYFDGLTIMCMIGGAGGAFKNLFSDFKTYYPLLRDFLKEKKFITGIDLDIEENVKQDDVKNSINCLVNDFGEDFIITMAPVADSLLKDSPSGFSSLNYKELYESREGGFIDWFNVQAYGNFSFETYDKIIKNNYNPENIVFGMISGDFLNDNFHVALKEIDLIKKKYPNMGGCDVWELVNAPPDMDDPSKWAENIKQLSN